MNIYEYLKKPTYLFDSHCHLNDSAYDKIRIDTINSAREMHVTEIFDISVNKISIEKIESFNNQCVKRFIGIDPEIFIPGSELFDSLDKDSIFFEDTYNYLNSKLQSGSFFGIGETGMDFYWLNKNNEQSSVVEKSKKLQEQLFRIHLELAQKFNLPISIHSRFAEEECLKIVKEYDVAGFFHSFTGELSVGRDIITNGFGIGLNGIATYTSASNIRDMITDIAGKNLQSPEDFYKKGFFFETDGPYLIPRGVSSKINKPEHIKNIFDYLVEKL